MSVTTIVDSRIRLVPSKKLLNLITSYKEEIAGIPANLFECLKTHGCELRSNIDILQVDVLKQHKIDLKLLSNLNEESKQLDNNQQESILKFSEKLEIEKTVDGSNEKFYLYLTDLNWLNSFLARLRKVHGLDIYLHQLLKTCPIVLPENEFIERNPELEARCEKLRQEQQNREYMKMTKNVDAALKHYPEDTIAYQMKTLNKQIIAVFQFVLSVVAGFAFGFFGLEWSIGGLDFGLRLLLGIMFALIIALAEIYFLAKKLNEYDDVAATANNFHHHHHSPAKSKKPHKD